MESNDERDRVAARPLALERSRLFDQEAEAYDRFRPTYPDAVIDELLGPEPAGLDVLDVGCGTGIASRQIAERGAKVLGVELAPRMAEIARSHGIDVELAAFEDWDAAGRTFDRVISAQAWHWLDLPVATAKAAALLRPGGRLCLIWNAGWQPDDLADALEQVYASVVPPGGHRVFRGYAANRSTDARTGLETELAAVSAVPDLSAPTEKWFPWTRTYQRDEWQSQLLSRSDHTALPPDVLDRLLEGIGAAVSGWAKQRERRTVQGELETALRTVTRSDETFELTVAGRTDAGVHARGQVAHVDLPEAVWAEHGERLLRRLAGRLPKDVRVWRAEEAPYGFNARFSAIWRRYAYRVTDHPGGVDPLLRGHVLWHDWELDVDAMNAASQPLLGEHDFAAYCKRREGATTIRTLQQLSWERDAAGVLTGTVRADAFCHNMVRSLVGALLFVGDGHRPVDWPGKVLAAGVRDSAVHVVRPHGLTLEEVGYPADELLMARNQEARNKRTLPGAGCC